MKGSTVTRAQTGEEAGSADENAIKSLEFFVFNSDGSYQKYFKPEVLAANNQYTFLVDAGNLTVLTAVNQNLGEPSPAPASLTDFKKNSLYKELLLMARILVQISVLPQDLLWRQKGRLMLWRGKRIR
ncbi:MAG: fimbrial protein [Barnesiella intestinihominis]